MRRSKVHKDMEAWFERLPPGPGRLLFFPCLWDLDGPTGKSDAYVVWYDADWRVMGGGKMWITMDLHADETLVWETNAPNVDARRVKHAYLLDARDLKGQLISLKMKLTDAQFVMFDPNGGGPA